jgi:hypothetical protein
MHGYDQQKAASSPSPPWNSFPAAQTFNAAAALAKCIVICLWPLASPLLLLLLL